MSGFYCYIDSGLQYEKDFAENTSVFITSRQVNIINASPGKA